MPVRSLRLALLLLCMSIFMTALDATIVNIAIPSILTSFHASLDQILWVVNAYLLVYAALLITAGRLGDLFGQRTVFVVGIVVFTLASALCGLSHTIIQLIGARILQGMGSALLTAQSLALLTSLFPPERRGAALGLYSGVAGVGAVVGPIGGGLIISLWGWPWIFFVNVPIGLVVLVVTFALIPAMRVGKYHRLDLIGILLSTAGLFGIIFALIEGQRYQWGTITGPVTIPEVLIGGVVALLGFVLWERVQTEPLLPLSLFSDLTFSIMAVVNAALFFGLFGLVFVLTLYLQSVLGMTALLAGLTLAPLMLSSIVAAPLAGRLSDRGGGMYLLIAGLLLFAGGIGLLVWRSTADATWLDFLVPLIVAGAGMGSAVGPMMGEAMRGTTPHLVGVASGVISTTRQVGSAIGGAVIGAVLQNSLVAALHDQTSILSGQLPVVLQRPFLALIDQMLRGGVQIGTGQSNGTRQVSALTPIQTQQLHHLTHEASIRGFVVALHPTLLVVVAVLFVSALLCLPIARQRKQLLHKEITLAEHANEAQEQFEVPQNMMVYYLRLLKRGPLWTPEETPEIERLQAAHLAHGQKLSEAGKLILNGPLLDNGDVRGVGIFRVNSLVEAQALSEADPAVQAGRLVSELHPWMIFRGILPEETVEEKKFTR